MACMRVCVCMLVCTYVFVYVCVREHVCVCLCLHVCVRMSGSVLCALVCQSAELPQKLHKANLGLETRPVLWVAGRSH